MRRPAFDRTERAFLALLVGLAAGALVVPTVVATRAAIERAPFAGEPVSAVHGASTSRSRDGHRDAVTRDDLTGLWTRWEDRTEGAPIRFWYFHGDGKGLYRYGRVGHTNTHSFDYRVVDGRLSLHFRKTGAEHEVDLRIDEDDRGRPRLRLDPDPEEQGARYVRVADPVASTGAVDVATPGHPGGRLWIDHRKYATGGAGFVMYQFNAPAIDGRGIGWFHEGDFDDWSTESLTYRLDGDRLELYFDLREEHAVSTFEVRKEGAHRYLDVRDDPRDFYKDHTYVDAGASFGGLDPARAHLVPTLVGPWTHAAPGPR